MQGPDPFRCEKNWVPFIKDNRLHVVYSYDPFIIYQVDPETGECHLVLHETPDHEFSSFRGSAAPIPFDEGYLMIVHEVVHHPDYTRSYLHRFLYLDHDFHIQRLSKPFIFLHTGIEFCCSMIMDHSGRELIIPIGIEDREAHLCFVSLDTVRSLLRPLSQAAKMPFQN